MKKIFKDSSGRQQSAIEEEKALKAALRKLEEADQKILAVRKSIKRLEKEVPLYKGMVQRFATDVVVEIPSAIAMLENLVLSLEAYTSMEAPVEVTSSAPMATSGVETSGAEVAGSMARSVEERKDEEKKAESDGSKSQASES
jgi:hypothetical protein